MAASNTLITAASYNTLQAKISTILGLGTGDSGYGQKIASSQVNANSPISSNQWDNLRADIVRCYAHQTGNPAQDTAWNNSLSFTQFPPSLQDVAPTTVISGNLQSQYNNFINEASLGISTVANRARAHVSQITSTASPIALLSTSYSTAWNAIVVNDVTITWNGYTPPGGSAISAADHARVFFNSGGVIRISASRSGGSATTKNTAWTNMLSLFGVFSFGLRSSAVSGSFNTGGSVNLPAAGWEQLTASYQLFMTQSATTGVYAENRYKIYIQKPTTNQIRIRMVFNDLDTGDQTGLGPPVDENIDGTLTSIVQCLTANTANVDVPMTLGTSVSSVSNSFGPSATET